MKTPTSISILFSRHSGLTPISSTVQYVEPPSAPHSTISPKTYSIWQQQRCAQNRTPTHRHMQRKCEKNKTGVTPTSATRTHGTGVAPQSRRDSPTGGSVESRTNVCLALTSQQLMLQVQLHIFPTLRHFNSHGEDVGYECATMSTHIAHTLVSTQLTFSKIVAIRLKFNTDHVTLVVDTRHYSGDRALLKKCGPHLVSWCLRLGFPPCFIMHQARS